MASNAYKRPDFQDTTVRRSGDTDPRGHDSSHTLPLGPPPQPPHRKGWTAQWTGLLAASKAAQDHVIACSTHHPPRDGTNRQPGSQGGGLRELPPAGGFSTNTVPAPERPPKVDQLRPHVVMRCHRRLAAPRSSPPTTASSTPCRAPSSTPLTPTT